MMDIISKAMGEYETNCYIISNDNMEIIIDPGVNAVNWVIENTKNPIAIFNTHGHFDHIWSNAQLKKRLNIPIYCPKDDVFMLSMNQFGVPLEPSIADFEVNPNEKIDLIGLTFKFWHFPGHTPGCSAIEVEDYLFSGDFLFKNSIGRTDFPYGSPEKMKQSLEKIINFQKDLIIFPGHGVKTTLSQEKKQIPSWIKYLS